MNHPWENLERRVGSTLQSTILRPHSGLLRIRNVAAEVGVGVTLITYKPSFLDEAQGDSSPAASLGFRVQCQRTLVIPSLEEQMQDEDEAKYIGCGLGVGHDRPRPFGTPCPTAGAEDPAEYRRILNWTKRLGMATISSVGTATVVLVAAGRVPRP